MPTPFQNIPFPSAVARGASGGPGFMTEIVSLGSGAEQRNIRWAQARAHYNISTGIRTREEMAQVIAHFRNVFGRAYSFPFQDWTDYVATAVPMVSVTATVWQLVKTYSIGPSTYTRTITKPMSGSVAITVNGTTVTPANINYATGLVTFASAPAATPVASFQFYVPVRYDIDQLPVTAEAYTKQVVNQIDLVEVMNE